MNSIRPRTYNEILMYKRCLALRKYIPGIKEDLLRKIYDFLLKDKRNSICFLKSQVGARLAFLDVNNLEVESETIYSIHLSRTMAFTTITLSALAMKVVNPYTSSGGDGGDGGSNNNNNNNNNNNG